jgi:hypothetical protein
MPPELPTPYNRSAARLSVWEFRPGLVVRVGRSFTDRSNHTIEAGQILHFVKRDYVPYESGHTLTFKEMRIYLQDTDPSDYPVIENFENIYFQPIAEPTT